MDNWTNKMNILVISDVRNWDGYLKVFDHFKPDIVVLAGDLTANGVIDTDAILNYFPDYTKRKEHYWQLRGRKYTKLKKEGILDKYEEWSRYYVERTDPEKRHNFIYFNAPKDKQFIPKFTRIKNRDNFNYNKIWKLRSKYRDSFSFEKKYRELFRNGFYNFIKYAGKNSVVLIIKGDHDKYPSYNSSKISRIVGCHEISGKISKVGKTSFLGVSFDCCKNETTLKKYLANKKHVDIVVAHSPQQIVPLLSTNKPRLIIRGHFGQGCFFVNHIPSAFTDNDGFTLIKYVKNRKPIIVPFYFLEHAERKVCAIEYLWGCSPSIYPNTEYKLYKWLKPGYTDIRSINKTLHLSKHNGLLYLDGSV